MSYKDNLIHVISIDDNEDGSANIQLDLSNEFITWFKEVQGLKRFSKKRFNKWFISALEEALVLEEEPSNEV